MTPRGRVVLVRVVLVAVSFAIGLVGVGLLPGLERRGGSLPDYGAIHRFDPAREGGHLLPDLDQWMQGKGGDDRVRIVTNSKGFRNRKEFAYAVPEGTFRILLLGDSFVDGMRTDQDATIGAVLERRLKERAADTPYRDFEVMISGHNNPADAWYAFQEHGRKYGPQLVVLGLTLGNDLAWQGYRRWMQPIATGDGGTRLHFDSGSMELAASLEGIRLPPEAFEPESAWELLTRAEMKARRFLADRFGFAGYAMPIRTAPFWSSRRDVHAADFFLSLGLFCPKLVPEAEGWYRDLDEVLAGLRREVVAAGGRLLVLVFPVRIQVDPRDWELLCRAYAMKAALFELDEPDRRIAAIAGRLELACVDLTEPFRAQFAAGRGPLYRPRGDMHFNEAGQELAAETLCARLLETVLR